MVIPPPRRSRPSVEFPHTGPTATERWNSIRMAMPSSSSVPTRMVFLLHGEDPFRTRLRLGELAAALLQGAPAAPTDLATMVEPRLGALLGITRHDARFDTASEIKLDSEAVATLAGAAGSDTERIEQEIKKLGAYAGNAIVTAADVRTLVSGAIEADVFELTQAVVRKDARTAVATLERLLADGNAVQQILALLLLQFRVLLFASAMRTNADAERMAQAIRSSPFAIQRATAVARRVTRADVVRAYEAIYAADQVIKTGRAESDVAALTLCVLDLCGVANADLRDMLLVEAPRR